MAQMSSKCFYHAACVLQNSHHLHLEIWQVFKGLSWTETHYFSLQRPPAPFPYETHILLNIPLLTLPRTFSGFKLCSWCTWSNLFWTSFVQKKLHHLFLTFCFPYVCQLVPESKKLWKFVKISCLEIFIKRTCISFLAWNVFKHVSNF